MGQPADPPGLDAAIEDALATTTEHAIAERSYGWRCACGATGTDRPTPRSKAHRHLIKVELRAAAPALRAGALRDAARDLGASERRSWSRAETFRWLIERADREVAT